MSRNPESPRSGALALLLAMVLPVAAHPADRVEIGDLSLDDLLDPVQAAASLGQQRSSLAPASVFVVSAQDLRDHGYRTLAEALRGVPGLFTYADGFYEYVGVRGTGLLLDYTTRLLVLVDGHPLNNTVGAAEAHLGPDFLLPLPVVERIEVVKGPVGGVYGPTAFLGVVNVVTRRPTSPEGEVSIAGQAAQGHLSGLGSSVVLGGKSAGLAVVAAAEARGGAGYRWTFPALAGASDRPSAPGGRVAGADGSDAQKAYLRIGGEELSAATGCGRWFRRLPSAPYSAAVGDRRNAAENLDCFLQLGLERRLGEETVLTARLSYDDFRYRDLLIYEEPPADVGPFRDRSRDSWLGAHLLVDWRRPGLARLAAGVTAEVHDTLQLAYSTRLPSLQVDPVGGLGVGPIRKRYGTGHVHLVGELELRADLVLHGGLTGTWHELFGERLTPRVALVWAAGPHTLKALYAEGFRPPTAAEAFFNDAIDYIPNHALRPEQVRSAELAYERRHGPLTLAVALFHNRYDNLLTVATVPAPGLAGPPDPANPADFRQQYVNAGRNAVTGVDAWASLHLPGRLDATLGVSAQRPDAAQTNAPGLSGSLALSSQALWRPLTLALRAAWLSARQKDPAARDFATAPRVGALLRLDASARLAVPRVRGLELEAGIGNLLDARLLHPVGGDFAPISEMGETPREVRLGLRLLF